MRTRFYIEKRKDESGRLLLEERPVFMSITFHGKRVILGTGIKTDISGWDPGLQAVSINYPDSQAHNSWLSTLQEIAERTMNTLQHSGDELSAENFRILFQKLKPEYSSGFFENFFQFLDSGLSRWSTGTYRKVRTIFNLLRDFEDQSGYRLSYDRMNELFLDKFTAFCTQKAYKPSTTFKAVSILVWFLNWASDQGFNIYREYRQFYKLMEPLKETSRTPLSLKWEELIILKEYNPDSRIMERAKDLFCFMCFSGVRFSEIQLLKKEDMNAGEFIIRKPGGRVRRLPLNKYGREIYRIYENKYYLNSTAFPSMSIITMNKYLRMMGKEARLNRQVPNVAAGDGSVPLHKRLTAGIAVNTFIANALELDVPADIIAEFTGIRNDSRVRGIKRRLALEEMNKFDQL
jgi:integrase